MSNIRHRKPTSTDNNIISSNNVSNGDGNDPPPLVNCESWERNFECDNQNNNNGYCDGETSSDPTTLIGRMNASISAPLSTAIATTTNNNSTIISSSLDKFLATYCSFSARTFTTDQGLKVLQWSLWALSYVTKSNKHNKHLSPSLRKLYLELSFTRYILRFYGFLQSLEGYRSGSWAGGDKWENPLIPKIAKYVLAGSMLLYYPLEHVAYVGWQVPKLVPRVNANKFSAMSCWFWTIYIVGDFWMNCLKWKELKKKLGETMLLNARKKVERKTKEDDTVSRFCCS